MMPKFSGRSSATKLRFSPYGRSGRSVVRALWPAATPTSGLSMQRKRSRPSQIGHYQGPLPRPKRPARANKFALYGSRSELERYGKVSHADCLYLGAQSAPAYRIGNVIGSAFIRMVMKKHYHREYTEPSELLAPQTGAGGVADYFPYSLKFWRKQTAAEGIPTYAVAATFTFDVASDTVASFGRWFSDNVVHGDEFGGNWTDRAYNTLHAYQFVQLDGGYGVGQNVVNQAVIPVEEQYITVYSTVRMHIQNVTTADGLGEDTTGAVYQSTRIDANPVKGKLLRFRGPLPLIKSDRGIAGTVSNDFGWQLQQDTNADGIIWPQTAPVGQWLQLPNADQFKNCVGIASVSLEPGAIKDYTIPFKFSGTLQKYIDSMNAVKEADDVLNPRAPIPDYRHRQLGSAFMFALEKRLPTGNANVSINFHYEHYCGAVFGGRKKPIMVRQALSLGATVADPHA